MPIFKHNNTRFNLSDEILRYLKYLIALCMGFDNYAEIHNSWYLSNYFIPRTLNETPQETQYYFNKDEPLYNKMCNDIKEKILKYENNDTHSILYKIFFEFDVNQIYHQENKRFIYSSEIKCLITIYNILIDKYKNSFKKTLIQLLPFMKYLETYADDMLYY